MPFFMTDDRIKIFYEISGQGKSIVLIHGLTANHRFYKKQIPVLEKHFQVIALDLRGHGASEASSDSLTLTRLAKDVKQLLEHLKILKTSFIGWSMGAHVIFEYIKNYSCKEIEKIVIIDMAPKALKSEDWRFGLTGVFSRKTGDFGHEDNLYMLSVMLNNWQVYSKIVAHRIFNKSLYNEKMEFNTAADFKGKEDLPWIYEEERNNKACVIAAFWIAMAVQDYRPLLKDITVPCLLTYGAESNYYPPENCTYMAGQMPDARVVEFKECGHALHIQDPDFFNKTVMDFLSSIVPVK